MIRIESMVAGTYYDILQIPSAASKLDIKRSYERLALQWHPDKHSNSPTKNQANDYFRAIKDAYEILSDDLKREEYDLSIGIDQSWKSTNQEQKEESAEESWKSTNQEQKEESAEESWKSTDEDTSSEEPQGNTTTSYVSPKRLSKRIKITLIVCGSAVLVISVLFISSVYHKVGIYEEEINAKYKQVANILGEPSTGIRETGDGLGYYQKFHNGFIFWSPNNGAHEVHGSILSSWDPMNREHGPLGYPISDEYAVEGGRQSDFEHGSLYWNAATGEVTVLPTHTSAIKEINAKYKQVANILGEPSTGIRETGDGLGYYQKFYDGFIFWSPNTGAHEVHGVIADHWNYDMNREQGPLGYPISDEYAVEGGRQSDFEHGSLYWNAATGNVSLK